MKKILLSGAALLALLGGSASAADLAVKARPLPPAPVLSWTGFYIGINCGGSIGVNSMTQTATLVSPPGFLGTNGLLSSTNRMVPTGGLFGGQLGYNWQTGIWVFGVEADWQWTSQKDSNTYCSPAVSTVGFFGFGANGFGYCLTNEQKLKDFGTARARAGVTTGDSLWYVTGGATWAKVEDNHLFVGSANAAIFPPAVFGPGPFLPTAASFSSRKAG